MPTRTYPRDVAETRFRSKPGEAAVGRGARARRAPGPPPGQAGERPTEQARPARRGIQLEWVAIVLAVLVVVAVVYGLGWLPAVEAPPASLTSRS